LLGKRNLRGRVTVSLPAARRQSPDLSPQDPFRSLNLKDSGNSRGGKRTHGAVKNREENPHERVVLVAASNSEVWYR
jgi:hypothetical protein